MDMGQADRRERLNNALYNVISFQNPRLIQKFRKRQLPKDKLSEYVQNEFSLTNVEAEAVLNLSVYANSEPVAKCFKKIGQAKGTERIVNEMIMHAEAIAEVEGRRKCETTRNEGRVMDVINRTDVHQIAERLLKDLQNQR